MLTIHSKRKPILVRFLWTEENAGATYPKLGNAPIALNWRSPNQIAQSFSLIHEALQTIRADWQSASMARASSRRRESVAYSVARPVLPITRRG
jgi:hypothetical protein